MFRAVMFEIESTKYNMNRMYVKKGDTIKNVIESVKGAKDAYLLGKKLDEYLKIDKLRDSIQIRMEDNSIHYYYLCSRLSLALLLCV